jgi:hypothetical protein
MIKPLILLSFVSAITVGCVDPEVENARVEAELEATCLAKGFIKETRPYYMCMIQENRAQAEASDRRRQMGTALAGGLQYYGQSRQQAYTYSPPRSTQCTSTNYGYTTQTNCNTY